MKFYVPNTATAVEAEEMLQSIVEFVKAPVPSVHARIRRICYEHEGQLYAAEVGRPISPIYQEGEEAVVVFRENNEEVIAIVGSGLLFICLPTRGALQGLPIMVGAHSVQSVSYFDPPPF
jgi:hypothetical protein